ncbi:MAG TPA: recombinase family protein, partial [Bryobacteraceae bacterium]|nr:recombinase family protein [Bryobacteraceae bacterium]
RNLLEAVVSSKMDRLVLFDLSRLSRDVGDSHAVRKQIVRKLGIPIVSIRTGRISDGTSESEFRDNLDATLDENEVAKILERTTRGRRTWAERGYWQGGTVAFGYRAERRTTEEGGKRTLLVLEIAPIPGHPELTEVKVIRIIYRKLVEGWSAQRIADYLNSRGIPARILREGRKKFGAHYWRPSRIVDLARNPIYKGEFVYAKRRNVTEDGVRQRLLKNAEEKRIIQHVPAIVSPQLWQRAFDSLRGHQLTRMAHSKFRYLLSRMLVCSECGRHYVGGGAAMYRCVGRTQTREREVELGGNRCSAKHGIRMDQVEPAIWEKAASFLANPLLLLEELERNLATTDDEVAMKREIAQTEAALVRNREVDRNNLQHLNEGIIHRGDFTLERGRLEKQRADLEAELATLQHQAQAKRNRKQSLQSAREMLASLQDFAADPAPPFEAKRNILELLVDSITVFPEGHGHRLEVTWRFQPDAERRQDQWRAADLEPLALNTTS